LPPLPSRRKPRRASRRPDLSISASVSKAFPYASGFVIAQASLAQDFKSRNYRSFTHEKKLHQTPGILKIALYMDMRYPLPAKRSIRQHGRT
jgi:hypothetical protein